MRGVFMVVLKLGCTLGTPTPGKTLNILIPPDQPVPQTNYICL